MYMNGLDYLNFQPCIIGKFWWYGWDVQIYYVEKLSEMWFKIKLSFYFSISL